MALLYNMLKFTTMSNYKQKVFVHARCVRQLAHVIQITLGLQNLGIAEIQNWVHL